MSPVLARYVPSDEQSFARLKQLCKFWPRVIAAQQSHILRDARYSASDTVRATMCAIARLKSQRYRHRKLVVNTCEMAPADRERLSEMISLWPGLSSRDQRRAVEYAELVTGYPVYVGNA